MVRDPYYGAIVRFNAFRFGNQYTKGFRLCSGEYWLIHQGASLFTARDRSMVYFFHRGEVFQEYRGARWSYRRRSLNRRHSIGFCVPEINQHFAWDVEPPHPATASPWSAP